MIFRKIFNHYFQLFKDPLYKNSFFLMITSLSSAAFGFVFWIVAAKLYSPSDVGLATVLISSMSLLVVLSRLGFDQSVIRYFPGGDKNKIFTTSLFVTTVGVILLGLIYVAGLNIWASELKILYQIAPIFILFLISSSIFSLSGFALVALRRADYFFFQNLFIGIRILFLFPLVYMGALGIFNSVGIAYVLALSVPIFLFWHFNLKFSGIDINFLKESFHFSFGNYLIGILSMIPTLILPVIVFNTLGSEQVAYYYLSFSIGTLILVIPTSFSTSIFVEGSHGIPLKELVKKSLSTTFLFLIPLIVIFLIFGDAILKLIGADYNEGFNLLIIMAISSIPFTIFQVFCSIKKVQNDINIIILFNLIISITILTLSYLFLDVFGITGVGYAWFIGYGIISLLIMVIT